MDALYYKIDFFSHQDSSVTSNNRKHKEYIKDFCIFSE